MRHPAVMVNRVINGYTVEYYTGDYGEIGQKDGVEVFLEFNDVVKSICIHFGLPVVEVKTEYIYNKNDGFRL